MLRVEEHMLMAMRRISNAIGWLDASARQRKERMQDKSQLATGRMPRHGEITYEKNRLDNVKRVQPRNQGSAEIVKTIEFRFLSDAPINLL